MDYWSDTPPEPEPKAPSPGTASILETADKLSPEERTLALRSVAPMLEDCRREVWRLRRLKLITWLDQVEAAADRELARRGR